MKFRFLRKLAIPLRVTPFHPQWLIFRHEKAESAEIGKIAKGFLLDIGAGRQEIRSELHPDVKYVALDYYDTSVHWYETKPNIFGDGQNLPIIILISNITAWIFSKLPHDKEGFMPQSHSVQWKKPA
jgi:hypothetical protein